MNVSRQRRRYDDKLTGVFALSFQEQLVLPDGPKRQFPTGLCCLTLGLVALTSVLVTASVYIYRHYSVAQVGPASALSGSGGREPTRANAQLLTLTLTHQQIPEDSLFHCRIVYEDSIYAPLRGRQELEENVGIYLEDNYEQISVPVPHFGGSDPADIIHDFQRVGPPPPGRCSNTCITCSNLPY